MQLVFILLVVSLAGVMAFPRDLSEAETRGLWENMQNLASNMGKYANPMEMIRGQFEEVADESGLSGQIDAMKGRTQGLCDTARQLKKYQKPLNTLSMVMPAIAPLNMVLTQMNSGCNALHGPVNKTLEVDGQQCACLSIN